MGSGFLGCHATFRDIPKNGCKGDYGQCESGVELLRVILYCTGIIVFTTHFLFCMYRRAVVSWNMPWVSFSQ